MRDLDSEDLLARVGVRVEVDEADRAMLRRAGSDVRLRDRVVAAEDDRDRTRCEHLSDRRLDRLVRASGVGGDDGRVAEVDHLQFDKGIDLRLEMLAW